MKLRRQRALERLVLQLAQHRALRNQLPTIARQSAGQRLRQLAQLAITGEAS